MQARKSRQPFQEIQNGTIHPPVKQFFESKFHEERMHGSHNFLAIRQIEEKKHVAQVPADFIHDQDKKTRCFDDVMKENNERCERDPHFQELNENRNVRTCRKKRKEVNMHNDGAFDEVTISSVKLKVNTNNMRTYKKGKSKINMAPSASSSCVKFVEKTNCHEETNQLSLWKTPQNKPELQPKFSTDCKKIIKQSSHLSVSHGFLKDCSFSNYESAAKETVDMNFFLGKHNANVATTTDDFAHLYQCIHHDYRVKYPENVWKRLNIVHLLGKNCESDLSFLCQLERDGCLCLKVINPITGEYASCEKCVSNSLAVGTCRGDSSEENENFDDISTGANSLKNLFCSKCVSICDQCRSPVNLVDHSSELVESLNKSLIPVYFKQSPEYSSQPTALKNKVMDLNKSGYFTSKKYNKFAENYKQNLMFHCEVCQSDQPLPHRLSIKLNYGLGIEFSHGNKTGRRISLPICKNHIVKALSSSQSKENVHDLSNLLNKSFIDCGLLSGDSDGSECLSFSKGTIVSDNQDFVEGLIHNCIKKYLGTSNVILERQHALDFSNIPMQRDATDYLETTGDDFSQICYVNFDDIQETNESNTLDASQIFWQLDSDNNSSASVNWNYTDTLKEDSIISIKTLSLHEFSKLSLDSSFIHESQHWSLEAFPAKSILESSRLHHIDSIHYDHMTEGGEEFEGSEEIQLNSNKKMNHSFTCKKIQCLCNCCLEVSSILWAPLHDGLNSSHDRIKMGKNCGACNPSHLHPANHFGHSTPQKVEHATPFKEVDVEMSSNVVSNEELIKCNLNACISKQHCVSTDSRHGFVKQSSQISIHSMQNHCWNVHRNWMQVKEKSHVLKSTINSEVKKFKAKDIIASKAQINLSIYKNSGLITVHVIAARKVYTKNLAMCNAFVKVSLYPEDPLQNVMRFKTAVIKNDRHPFFNEKFSFELSSFFSGQRLLISLWHQEEEKEKKLFLGCMSFGMKTVISKQFIQGWFRVLTDVIGYQKHFAVHTKSPDEVAKASKRGKSRIIENVSKETVLQSIHIKCKDRLI